MQMRSVYILMVCLVIGSFALNPQHAFASELGQKEAKLKKLGVKKKKSDLVIQHEKELSKKLAKLEKEKPAARKKAQEKLVKAHEKFLKQTLGDKTYAAYYKSSPARKIASEPLKKKKSKKADHSKKKAKKDKHAKAKKPAKKKHKRHEPSPVSSEEPMAADPIVPPANGAPSPSESPDAAPTEAAADAQAAARILESETAGGGHAPASVEPAHQN